MTAKKILRLLCVIAFAVAPAIAQQPAESATDSAAFKPSRQTLPRSLAPHQEEYDFNRHVIVSYNTAWAGYAVTGTDFTFVQGSWIVTAVDCTKTPNTDSSEWVGIDGWSSNTVEQIGTDADCNGKSPFYWVWYEFYPYGSVVINTVSIAPGNKFSASVTYDGDENYTVAIKNESTGESFSKKVKFDGAFGSGAPKRNSAEWIMEMDGNKLSDFGVDPFGEDYTGYLNDIATDAKVDKGVIHTFGDDVNKSVTTKTGFKGSPVTAQPSGLSSDGASFTVTWKAE
ncbi:MAG TPA: G1 family glutamic endopeptidase [Terriglobales bacterium]